MRIRTFLLVSASSLFAGVASAQLEEVIVTAQKRAESQQEVPITIQAFSAETLQLTGISNTDDLGVVTPGLQMAQGGVANVAFIRGLGNQDASGAQEGSVATYVDGMWYGSVTGSALSFNNIERIEVLKGPQGTLFGRNTTGGVINIITKDPSQERSGKFEFSYGNFETIGAKFYGTGGISSNLAADIAVQYSDQGKGYGRNLRTGGTGSARENEISARTKWKYSSEAFDATLSLGYEEYSDNMGYVRGAPVGSASVAGPTIRRGSYWDYDLDDQPFADFDSTTAVLRLDKSFDGWDLVSITGFKDDNLDSEDDNDSSGVYVMNAAIDFANTSTTQEFQFLSNNPESKVTWIAGAFFLDQKASGYYFITGPSTRQLFGPAPAPQLNGLGFGSEIKTTSYAGFGEVGYGFNDKTRLTVGLRYTEDTRKIAGHAAWPLIFNGNTAPFQGILAPQILSTPQKASFGEATYRVVLDHKLTDDKMLYFSFNHGFRSGNFNTVAPGDPAFNPELLDAFEVGYKSQLLDNRMRFNMSAYYYEVEDLQFQVLRGFTTSTVNAAAAEIKGFELETFYQATDELSLEFALAYMDGKYTSFPGATANFPTPTAPTNTVAVIPATGKKIAGAPESMITAALMYKKPLDNGSFNFSLRGTYNDGYPWEADGRLVQDSYTVVNLSAGWRAPDDKWGVSIHGRNLAEAEYSVTTRAQTGLGDFYAPAAPRTYFLTVDFNF